MSNNEIITREHIERFITEHEHDEMEDGKFQGEKLSNEISDKVFDAIMSLTDDQSLFIKAQQNTPSFTTVIHYCKTLLKLVGIILSCKNDTLTAHTQQSDNRNCYKAITGTVVAGLRMRKSSIQRLFA